MIYFRGTTFNGKEIFSDSIEDNGFGCIITCEETQTRYRIEKENLYMKFSGVNVWMKFNDLVIMALKNYLEMERDK